MYKVIPSLLLYNWMVNRPFIGNYTGICRLID